MIVFPDVLSIVVFAALNAAVENGYPMAGESPRIIAWDLAEYCPDVEGVEPSSLIPAIRAWLAARRSNAMQPLVDILNDPDCPIPGTFVAKRMEISLEARRLIRDTPWPFRWLTRRLVAKGLALWEGGRFR